MPLTTNVSGTHRAATVWTNVAGVWRKAALWTNVAGVWRRVTSLIAATLPANMDATSNAVEPSQANAQVAFNNAGGWSLSGINGTVSPAATGTWWDGANPASAYEIRWNLINGAPTTGPAVETWHSLSATRVWTSQGTNYTQGEIQIREAATGTILATSVVSLEAYTESGGPEP